MIIMLFSGNFGCFEWSPTEDELLYIAEKKYKKAVSYFDKPSDDEEKQAKLDVVSQLIVGYCPIDTFQAI